MAGSVSPFLMSYGGENEERHRVIAAVSDDLLPKWHNDQIKRDSVTATDADSASGRGFPTSHTDPVSVRIYCKATKLFIAGDLIIAGLRIPGTTLGEKREHIRDGWTIEHPSRR